jgi:adenine-specific DNA-methyltransferase
MPKRHKIGGPKKSTKLKGKAEEIEQYIHQDKKRAYNPPVGLVDAHTDMDAPKSKYAYDPNLDPQLQWAGKKEHTSFHVDTVSVHVHERIDPLTIIEQVEKKVPVEERQASLFQYIHPFDPKYNPPLRDAIKFYKHDENWSNRLIAGDSLLIMNSLLQKEGMAGKIQMIYIDPPYGIKYGSNFQPFVNKRDVKDGKDEDLTQEPETIKAFRDTWELGIHSYLTYLRDRLLLSKELLTSNGSIFVQISDENLHLVRCIMDEIFGKENFVSIIPFSKTAGQSTLLLPSLADFLLWYSKDKSKTKYHKLFLPKQIGGEGGTGYILLESPDGKTHRSLTKQEISDPKLIPKDWRVFDATPLISQDYIEKLSFPFVFQGQKFIPPSNRHWTTTREGMNKLAEKNRLIIYGKTLQYKRYLDDYPVIELPNIWMGLGERGFVGQKIYVVQTATKVLERCILMTTDPGDIILDPTCGSGTSAFVAEKWGRRWVTCDTSRVSIALTRQRIMTSVFDYYELMKPEEGITSGLKYKKVPHITLGSIANNEVPKEEILYDQAIVDKTKVRISGPFTVEAVPSPVVKSIDEIEKTLPVQQLDKAIARQGETVRQDDWREELIKTGVRGKSGQIMEFSRVEPLPGTKWLHADTETKGKDRKRAVVSFGPDHAPLEQRQVELAIEEAQSLVPKPKIVIFAAFQFDPEAAKDIDELEWPGIDILKVQMNPDLLTEDLKKNRASNQSFWLIGRPDVEIRKEKDKCVIEIKGFDYYNTTNGEIESGDTKKIAMWMLDTDYDGRSLYPRQVFFPLTGNSDGIKKLSKTLKAYVEENLIEAYTGTVSLPFIPGNKVAIKIVDDRGIESLRVLKVK